MVREPERTTGDTAPPAPSPRRRRRWWLAALAAGLVVAELAAKTHTGAPFALSFLDALALVAFAVLVGTYVILARAEREGSGGGAGKAGD